MERKPVFVSRTQGISQASTSSNLQSVSPVKSEYTEFKVRVPRNLSKKYYMMRFHTPSKMDLSAISKAQMGRSVNQLAEKEEDDTPKFGAGSEFGRERREENRKRRRGFVPKPKEPDSAPWQLKIGGKGGKRYTGRKEAGINENSAYYILTQTVDGTFEAVPVYSWYNFTQDISYKTLTADDAEEEFAKRDKTINYFSLMIKKRLENKEEEAAEVKDESKSKKILSMSTNMRIHDDDLEVSSDEDYDEDDDTSETKKETSKKNRKKTNTKQKQKTKKDSEAESDDASSEEDGYFDSKEVDYMSDTSSSEEELEETSKPKAADDLNAEETSSESEDEDLTKVGKELRKMLKREGGEESSEDEEEDEEDPDTDDMKGTSALFLSGKKKGKKNKASRSGSVSSTTTSSRSSTPTIGVNQDSIAAKTVAAAAKKLGEESPGTPSKSRKRPATQLAVPGRTESGSPASKKPRGSAPSSARSSNAATPVPSGEESHGITEEAVRRYLTRKPMTTKDLLQKFKTKRTGLTKEQTVQLIASILRKVKPEQTTIKNTMYLSLKS